MVALLRVDLAHGYPATRTCNLCDAEEIMQTSTLCKMFPHDRLVVSKPGNQWCAGAEGETELLSSRLVDFARMRWTNPAFRQMMAAFFCAPGAELCEPEYAVGTVEESVYSLLGNRRATAICR